MVHNTISKAIPAGKTRAQVAREAGISRVHLQRIMAGKQQPTIAIALRLSATLQTQIDLLFYLDEEGMRTGTEMQIDRHEQPGSAAVRNLTHY